MNIGWNPGNGSSSKRRVNVLRGFDGMEPSTFTKIAPVAAGQAIYSGMIISLNNANEWVKGQFTSGKTCYIALSNYDDTDVSAAGALPALSCAGQFEIETAWYASAGTYIGDLSYLKAEITPTGEVINAAYDITTTIGKVTNSIYRKNYNIAGTNQYKLLGTYTAAGAVSSSVVPLNNYTTTGSGSTGSTAVDYPFQSNEAGIVNVLTFITVQK